MRSTDLTYWCPRCQRWGWRSDWCVHCFKFFLKDASMPKPMNPTVLRHAQARVLAEVLAQMDAVEDPTRVWQLIPHRQLVQWMADLRRVLGAWQAAGRG